MTNEERKLITDMWNNGVPFASICQMLPYNEWVSKRMIFSLFRDGTLRRDGRMFATDKIVEYYKQEKNPYEIAKVFGTSKEYVDIVLTLAKVKRTRPPHNYKKRKPTDHNKLSDRTREIIALLESGKKPADIARECNVSRQHVHKVKDKYVKEK